MTDIFNPTALAAAETARDLYFDRISKLEETAKWMRLADSHDTLALTNIGIELYKSKLDVQLRIIAAENAKKRLEDIQTLVNEVLNFGGKDGVSRLTL